VQKRLATEKADVANTSVVKNLQGGIESASIDPSLVFAPYFAVREVGKVARCIARICDRNIAQRGAAVPDKS
jgi:hypothetical protein